MLKTLAFAAFAGALSLSGTLLTAGTAKAAPATTGLILPTQETSTRLIEKVGDRGRGHYRRAHYRRQVYHRRQVHHRRVYYRPVYSRPAYYRPAYHRPVYYRPAYVAPVYYGRRCRIVRQQVWNGWGYVVQPVRICRRHW